MKKLLAQQWCSYLEQVLPGGASPVQAIETRRAFYAGARAMMSVVFCNLSGADETTAEDLAVMESLQAELEEFVRDVAEGRA